MKFSKEVPSKLEIQCKRGPFLPHLTALPLDKSAQGILILRENKV